ncbi:MAG: FAD binding domain-containing protein [Lachnospiraceae bacterium]|nr:FAD binding domain-containing protein [Candidatus Equihabitans merdae]
MLQYKEYLRPTTIEELFSCIKAADKAYDIVSGGTDLYAKEQERLSPMAIDISRIPALSDISLEDGWVKIGANTPVQQFIENAVLVDQVPLIRHAAIYFADQQIREAATIGGNVANSSPTGDIIPTLTAMDAVIQTLSMEDDQEVRRQISILEFIQGPGRNVLKDGEIVEAILCPVLTGYGLAFKKVGQRRSLCISTVNSAFMVKADPAQKIFEDVRIAFGAIGPVPQRVSDVEKFLVGKEISEEIINEALNLIPADLVKSRSRIEYRRNVVPNFVKAGLMEALAELGIAL